MMADFSSTKKDSTFEEWYEALTEYADLRGESVADKEVWREDYDAGKDPVETGCDEWGDDN